MGQEDSDRVNESIHILKNEEGLLTIEKLMNKLSDDLVSNNSKIGSKKWTDKKSVGNFCDMLSEVND